MGIDDLLVSYKQVHAPAYTQELDITPIGDELISQENIDRVQSRSKEGFQGWKFPTTSTVDNEISSNKPSTETSSNDIVNFFISKGLTKNQAKGIYGNIMQESRGQNNAQSRDGYYSYGLAQWTGPRKARLFSKYGTHPSTQQQLEYLWEELNSSEKGALNALKNTSTVEDATRVFCLKFERPGKGAANLERRIKFANSIA